MDFMDETSIADIEGESDPFAEPAAERSGGAKRSCATDEDSQLGPSLVYALFSASKMVQIYEIDNNAVKRSVGELHAVLQKLFRCEERALLRISSEYLTLNDERITVDPQSFSTFQYLMDELKKREVEGIEFFPGVNEKTIGTFLKVFFELDEGDEPFDRLEEQIKRADIQHIVVTQLIEMERHLRVHAADQQDVRLESNRIFFRTVGLMKDLVRGIERQNSIQVRKAKRLTQQMVDIIQTDESIFLGLASIKKFDEYTYAHSVNVCIFSMAMGDQLRLCKSDIARLGLAALFHDIGKVYIPVSIVNSPDKLEGRDWELMKYHTVFGIKELSKVKSFKEILDAMYVSLQHHVHYDLNGYPQKKNGWDLRLFSRIVTIADFYDAMTTPRVYRPNPLQPERVLRFILMKSGSIFDPFLAKVFIQTMGFYPVGTVVELDTGERGVVVRQNHSAGLLRRPVVRLLSTAESSEEHGGVIDLSSRRADRTYERSIVRTLEEADYAAQKDANFLLT
jgi:putative nucleotidyltransferase with HDIG domain